MKRIGLIALAGAVVASIALADDTGTTKGWRGTAKKGVSAAKTNAAESGLIGVKLYDTGLRVIQLYGSPDEIQDVVSGAGTSIGPAQNAGGGGQGRGGGGGNRRGGGSEAASAEWNIPNLDWKPINFMQEPPPRVGQSGSGGGATIPAGGGGQGAPPGAPGGAGGGQAGTGQAENRIVYTRWVYRKGNSRYAFILNRYNQVIQIEAIGMNDPRVSTNRGVRYGAQFADILKKYGAPDGYEINGNTLVLRYLVNSKVAFRMNRLKTDGKHVVTGVVVAAGKM